MLITENISLAPYTTFKIGGPARFFCAVTSEAELVEAVAYAKKQNVAIFVLGGGSNILISDDGFDGLVIKMDIQGITMNAGSDSSQTTVSVGAGENWDSFVEHMVTKGLYGVENLSAIPGTVGAAAVQNIGAYGVEVKDPISKVKVYDTQSMKFSDFTNEQCQFTYRSSIFKNRKSNYIVVSADFMLSTTVAVTISYPDVARYFSSHASANPTLEQVRAAIIEIRANKLPSLQEWGTAGSFFKNPIIAADTFRDLKEKYPELPGYPETDGRVKVSLGWILDKVCDAKGLTAGAVGTYSKQALVIVATTGATATQIKELVQELKTRVKSKTGIDIEEEVLYI